MCLQSPFHHNQLEMIADFQIHPGEPDYHFHQLVIEAHVQLLESCYFQTLMFLI